MFLSSSVILLKVNLDNLDDKLGNFMSKSANDGSFLSIDFVDDLKTKGEIHWSKSFEFGKMNLVNFVRVGNVFCMFTSAVQNYKYLELALSGLMNEEIEIGILKIPLNLNKEPRVDRVIFNEIDPLFGISATVEIHGRNVFLKMYTNGLITYTLTNEEEVTLEVLKISLAIMGEVI